LLVPIASARADCLEAGDEHLSSGFLPQTGAPDEPPTILQIIGLRQPRAALVV
jgi:hypothetical protein